MLGRTQRAQIIVPPARQRLSHLPITTDRADYDYVTSDLTLTLMTYVPMYPTGGILLGGLSSPT